ncbi:farnesylcysteine lyase isoform X2 [Momordica charantia]|uniref:Farnesylcysteine lyase isoform X2 n=1 Tax=Momordica charantia TaxID=3673 RepID=A0A6J1E3C0_MOMCH|nr:farnesylcysteine lyase isoform X2 [Momordica charantia]XP_022159246.1 farnesylcysteine lyase isoform X2 [Momordica charantia]XP_022159247.1 farnesylcysteine lyase isoform X2 [Momordica charantia]
MYMVGWSTIGHLFLLFLVLPPAISQSQATPTVCIVGSGIGGSSVSHFLRHYAAAYNASTGFNIRIFERHNIVGGRMATVNVAGDTFEAGASILHPKNLHALRFTDLLNLTLKKPSSPDSLSLGIWDGHRFVFKTLNGGLASKIPLLAKILQLWNQLLMFFRYGFSLLRMEDFVESAVGRFSKYYESFESRPVFETVTEMLNWSGLYNLTTRTLFEELIDARLSRLLIQELVTVITRINYGQSVSISGLAGAVSLAGSGGGLWSVEGGNWQIAARLINHSDSTLHLQEEIESISYLGEYYEVKSNKGNSYTCEITVVATPLDELNIQFTPPIVIPKREMQHTHTTFVRGLLNPGYFGLKTPSSIPKLVGTKENDNVQFSSISVLKQHDDNDMTYKIFSRKLMKDTLLDKIFSWLQRSFEVVFISLNLQIILLFPQSFSKTSFQMVFYEL